MLLEKGREFVGAEKALQGRLWSGDLVVVWCPVCRLCQA